MALYTHISVCFSVDDNTFGRCIAKSYMRELEKDRDNASIELIWMLKAFSEGNGIFTGPKGSLFNWGIVGNYTGIEDFITQLIPFLEALRSDEDTGFCDFEHAIVFYEREGSESATVYEIMPFENNAMNPLIWRVHENMPFTWMQM